MALEQETICLLGLGLMNASLALALRKHGFTGRIIAYARREETRAFALEQGMVDAVFDDPSTAVGSASLVVVGTPTECIVPLLKECVDSLPANSVVTDVGSTKAQVVRQADEIFSGSAARFVGSHPICGSEKSGIEAGDADLYDGAVTVICGEDEGGRVAALWTFVGSRTLVLDPQQHDAALARTSHLPHLASSILALTVARDSELGLSDFIGTGFKGSTRLADGSPEMWRDILSTNREAILAEMRAMAGELDKWIENLDRADYDALQKQLMHARDERRRLLEENE